MERRKKIKTKETPNRCLTSLIVKVAAWEGLNHPFLQVYALKEGKNRKMHRSENKFVNFIFFFFFQELR